jgi:general secretion pathway protein G
LIRKIRNSLKREDGFTLIEMLVVVAVLGILATLAVPRIADVTEKTENVVAQSNLKNFHVSMISARMADEDLDYPSAITGTVLDGTEIDLEDYGIDKLDVESGAKGYVAAITGADGAEFVIDTGNFVETYPDVTTGYTNLK